MPVESPVEPAPASRDAARRQGRHWRPAKEDRRRAAAGRARRLVRTPRQGPVAQFHGTHPERRFRLHQAPLDDETLQDLEDVLIQADLGLETATRITEALSAQRYGRDVSERGSARRSWPTEIEKVLGPVAQPLELDLGAQAACHPRCRRQRLGQDDDHRQARRKTARRRSFDVAGGGRHLSRRGDRAVEDLGRAHRFAGHCARRSARTPQASPSTPSTRRGQAVTT